MKRRIDYKLNAIQSNIHYLFSHRYLSKVRGRRDWTFDTI
jgi:hypothetical protein